MVGRHHQLNGHGFEQILGDSEGQGSPACCSPWGRKESDTTEGLNNNKYTEKCMDDRRYHTRNDKSNNIKTFRHTKAEITHYQQICTIISVKESPSGRRNIILDRNLDLHKEKHQKW